MIWVNYRQDSRCEPRPPEPELQTRPLQRDTTIRTTSPFSLFQRTYEDIRSNNQYFPENTHRNAVDRSSLHVMKNNAMRL